MCLQSDAPALPSLAAKAVGMVLALYPSNQHEVATVAQNVAQKVKS